MSLDKTPLGDPSREAIDSLRGYVYQIYQSALAWTELEDDELLYLEVAEDFAIVAEGALEAVQAKETAKRVTINSEDIIATIDSFVELQERNPSLKVTLRHLTTSTVGKEQKREHRVGDTPSLLAWRNLAKAGDLSDLRRVLDKSKLSKKSKDFIKSLNDEDLRERFLKRIHFDCGAPESHRLEQQINLRISKLLIHRGGVHSQTQTCVANILLALLKLSTNSNRDERRVDRISLEEHLDAATHVTLNRVDFETQNRLVNKAFLAAISPATGLSSAGLFRLSPVAETPLPEALASREDNIGQLQQILESVGLCWISGSAGMGKTVTARVLAHKNGGDWASINLRGQSSEQVARALIQAADSMKEFGLRGLIVDDLDWVMEPSVQGSLHYLVHSANRSDVLLVLNSSDSPTSDFLFVCDLQAGIARTLSEFTEEDIQEILAKYRVSNEHWAKYIHLVSGGGHPQLAMAFIQNMVASGWNPKELQTLDALLLGSPAINEVRKRTRERLLKDMPKATRQLIERLSLKTGGFSRELAIDLGKLEPQISDAGIILDTLIGSWVDQLEGDRFNLSPLLSGFAEKTLGTNEKEEIHSAIADSLTKKRSLDVIDMNSALFAAWSSKNDAAMIKLCMAILGSDSSELGMIAPHLSIFRMFRTDTIAYPANAAISHMFRGAQVLLVNQESDSPVNIQDALRRFSEEAKNVEHDVVRESMNLLIYSKLLIQTSKKGMGTNFISVIQELDQLLENENCVLPSEALDGIKEIEKEGISAIGFMFVNQAGKLSKIEELSVVFDFLESSSSELRSRLLAPLGHDDFDVDLLVTGAWLNEHKEDTIDPSAHSAVFARLEKLALGWNQTDLAVCCRKFRAIILDEYGNDKNGALAVLEEGLSMFGQTNSELVREKAKVLYRSDDHEGSLALSKTLIESDAPLNEIEKAFLGRDAAISAEKQGDFETARRFYLFGSVAAHKSNIPDMAAMHIGLLADAALASWHDGDRQTCLQDFVTVLDELSKIKPDETLRTAHCHAVARHVLLWLDRDITGEKRLLEGGEEITIYPGCVSNPEPHPKIKERYIPPIEISWYMLAKIENNAVLDAGITDNLKQFLSRGPVLEGQILLSPAKMHKALSQLDIKLFVEALQDIISLSAFAKEKREWSTVFNLKNPTYGTFPIATKEQQENLQGMTEQFVLLYCATCIFKDRIASIPVALRELTGVDRFLVRPVLIDCLRSNGSAEDYYTGFASLILTNTKGTPEAPSGSPREVFDLALKALQVAQQTGHYKLVAENLLPWLVQRCSYILEHQRFRLIQPSLHEADIRVALEQDGVSTETKVAEILTAILPTLGISNQRELSQILLDLPG
ncbi:MAG: hypothetical protein F4X63_10585 [Nitrospira sp. SB0662_bin_26]|nr:hypothetical protein [Nitrospira sp. SB0662_bin_26]